MFGIITKGFIKKVHEAFDELNYQVNDNLSYDDFQDKVVYSLNHAKELEDAINVVRMFQFCLKEWNKIEKIFEKHLIEWSAFEWEGNSMISYCDDDEAEGNFYITNGINKKYNIINFAGIALKNDIGEFIRKGDKFYFDEESGEYIKYSVMSSTKMKLFNANNECLCNIVLSENMGVFLENNKTDYELIENDNGVVGFFDKKYIDSLSDDEEIDFEKCYAFFEWDILEKNSDLGVTCLSFVQRVNNANIFFLIAASTFLLFKRFIDGDKRNKRNRRMFTLAVANSWSRK